MVTVFVSLEREKIVFPALKTAKSAMGEILAWHQTRWELRIRTFKLVSVPSIPIVAVSSGIQSVFLFPLLSVVWNVEEKIVVMVSVPEMNIVGIVPLIAVNVGSVVMVSARTMKVVSIALQIVAPVLIAAMESAISPEMKIVNLVQRIVVPVIIVVTMSVNGKMVKQIPIAV